MGAMPKVALRSILSGNTANCTWNLSSSSRFEAGNPNSFVKVRSSKPTICKAVLCALSRTLAERVFKVKAVSESFDPLSHREKSLGDVFASAAKSSGDQI
jgi:hypothetical protein